MLKSAIIALGLIFTASFAQAADFVVSAPTLADIELVAQQIPGLWSPDSTGPSGDIPAHIDTGGADPTGWAWSPVGTWYVQSGTKTDAFGNTVPNMVPKDGNYYGLLRWAGDLATMPLPPGIAIVTGSQTINGVATPTYTITVPLPDGILTMISPPDPAFPLRFE